MVSCIRPFHRSVSNHLVLPGHRFVVLAVHRDRLPMATPERGAEVLGLRPWGAGSPQLPGRIEFVAYGPTVHLRLLSTSARAGAVTFDYKPENLGLEGTSTPQTRYTYHRTPLPACPNGTNFS
jgi:hypothetical protein